MPKYCYAVERNDEVVNFVQENKDAIGVVGVNWISDKDDSITRGFMKQVRVAAISSEYDSDGSDFYRPYQGFIADKSYPFIREVYMICRETYTGLGSGFMQFVAGEKGQRIILKNGMVPSNMPIRLVKQEVLFNFFYLLLKYSNIAFLKLIIFNKVYFGMVFVWYEPHLIF